MAGPGITIVNPRGRWPVVRWSLLWGWVAVLGAAAAGLGAYAYFSRDLPTLESLVVYRPRQLNRILSADGFELARFGEERRLVARPDEIPPRLRLAFLAAEDAGFYSHGGIDLQAVARAALHMLLERGRPRQGGSTITQQLAKILIGHRKTFARKAREAILARRLEAVLPKDQILWLYMNQVYLGRGAYGVEEAARAYFDLRLDELTLGQCAYLAGLPQRPSVLAKDHRAALERARYVLDQMVDHGWAEPGEARVALDGLELRRPRDPYPWLAPYGVEAVRRELVEALGAETVELGGLTVYTALRVEDQVAAREALEGTLDALDRRQGYRGPVVSLTEAQAARLQRAWAEGRSMETGPGEPTPALVQRVRPREANLVSGLGAITLDLDHAGWAKPYDPEAKDNRGRLKDLREILRSGDLVLVERGAGGAWSLAPSWPGVQGAILMEEVGTGYVLASVGGRDPDLSVFDRAHLACRQPGSVFKPVYYSLALASGFTPATLVTDAPLKLEQGDDPFPYRVRNADRRFAGDMILADALARSRNVPSIKIFKALGAEKVVAWARNLGIRSHLEPVDALALGASCVRLSEMVDVYSVFASQGNRVPAVLIRMVLGPSGEVLLDHRHPSDPDLSPAEALGKVMAWHHGVRVLDQRVAYVTARLLRRVVEVGTARAARGARFPIAGKTGTTDFYDAWFLGFTAQRVAGVWVGPDDNSRKLGRGEHGGKVALPVFVAAVTRSSDGYPPVEIPGEPPPGVEVVAVDPATGLLAGRGTRSVSLPFVAGTGPTERASSRQVEEDLDRLGAGF